MEAIGPVLIVMSLPLLLRWVPRNRFYGFRIPATMRSDALWYDANALAARHMLALGCVMVALEFVLPVPMRIFVLRWLGVIGLVVIIIADAWTAARWERQRNGH